MVLLAPLPHSCPPHVNFSILTTTKWLLRRRSDKNERNNWVCRLWREHDLLPVHAQLIPSFPAKDRPVEIVDYGMDQI